MAVRTFYDFIEYIAETRPLAGSYFGQCASMNWDAWRVVRLLNAEFDRLVPLAPRTVLDIGCGIGIYEREVLKRWPSARVVGCDLSGENIQAARKYEPGACFMQCDVERLPLEDASVDLALAVEVMEHFLHPERVMAELARVVRPGGTLVIVVPLAPPIPFVKTVSRIATHFIGSKVVEEGEFKEHMRIYDRKTLLGQCRPGWQVKRFVTFNLMTFAVAAVEKLSARLAGRITKRYWRALDRLDLLCGHLVYAKGLLIVERKTSP